ncbi:MAG: MFS transporter, partial [Gaiellaceae bacterium]
DPLAKRKPVLESRRTDVSQRWAEHSLPIPTPTIAVYMLAFVNAAILTAIFPLVPAFEEAFSLSKLEIGGLFAAGGLSFLLAAIPVGTLADRVGARSVTVASAGVLVVAALGQAVAVDFWTLTASRVVFALGSAGVLTAGISWLADSSPADRRPARIGGIMPIAGAGGLAGPALAGWLEDFFGTAVPFLVWMAVAIAVWGLVAVSERGARAKHGHIPLAEMLGASRASPVVLAACLLFLVGGLAEIVVSTLTPLQLDANGLSSGEVGLVFAAGAGAFVLVSSVVARLASRLTTLHAAGVAMVLVAASLTPLVISTSTAAIIAGVVARMAAIAVVYTVAFPLGTTGAASAAVGVGAVTGLLMLSSGTSNVIGPLGGAAIASATDDRLVYGIILGLCVLTAVWLALLAQASRKKPRPRSS